MTSVSETILADRGAHWPSRRRDDGVGSLCSVGASADDDELLWARIRRGDREAFAELVRAQHAALRRFAAGMLGCAAEGDDVAQRVLLDLWERRGTAQRPSSIRAHLLVCARNACLVRLRSGRRAVRWERAVSEEPHTPPPTPLDALAERHRRLELERTGARLADLVDGLEDDARTAIWMRFAAGASFDDISLVLGRPAHAVRALVYRQLALLRRTLEEESR